MTLKWHNAHLGVEQAWATTDGEFTGYEFRLFRTHEGARLEIWQHTQERPLAVGLTVTAAIEFDKPAFEDRAAVIALLKGEADRWLAYLCPQLRRSA